MKRKKNLKMGGGGAVPWKGNRRRGTVKVKVKFRLNVKM